MEKQETEEKDSEKQEKIDNKNPNDSPEKHPSAQEYHHARHALYFLYFGTYSIISEKASWCTKEKIERVLVHLQCLQEFLDEGTVLESAVNKILEALGQSKPSDQKEWGMFLFHNWTWILQFAAHYGEDKKCFPESYYEKLKNVLNF